MRAGFPHSEILGSKLACQLPEAYRRLQRPSSPVVAKASTTCTCSLDPITLSTLDRVRRKSEPDGIPTGLYRRLVQTLNAIITQTNPAFEIPGPLHFFRIVKEQPKQKPSLNAHAQRWILRKTGGANRDRTGDLLLAKQALSQLSYGPRSVSRGRRLVWWVWVDLNHRPHAYQACALTN